MKWSTRSQSSGYFCLKCSVVELNDPISWSFQQFIKLKREHHHLLYKVRTSFHLSLFVGDIALLRSVTIKVHVQVKPRGAVGDIIEWLSRCLLWSSAH